MSCNNEEAIIILRMQILALYSSLYCFQGSVGPEADSNSALKDQEAFYISSEEQVQGLSVQVSQSLPSFISPL